jgi:hypothetical protein
MVLGFLSTSKPVQKIQRPKSPERMLAAAMIDRMHISMGTLKDVRNGIAVQQSSFTIFYI